MKTAVILGRFQNYKLHDGYKAMLDYATKNYDKIVIILGKSYRKATVKDPLSVEIRKKVIRRAISITTNHKLENILFIKDAKTDVQWCNNLDTLVEGVVENLNFDFLVGRDSFEPHYVGKYKTRFVTIPTVADTSSTQDRDAIKVENVSDIYTFAKGVIHATQQPYPRIDVTVDCALFLYDPEKPGHPKLVLGRKAHEKGYRLPGGFVDTTDKTFRDAVVREMMEETKVVVHNSDLEYVESLNINDWRYRSGPDTCRTSLFIARLDMSKDNNQFKVKDLEAGDDLCEVVKTTLEVFADGSYSMTHPLEKEHQILVDLAVKHYAHVTAALPKS